MPAWTTADLRPSAGWKPAISGFPRSREAPDRVPAVERIHESAHLVAIPDIASLELRDCDVLVVDVVENCRDSHGPYFWKTRAASQRRAPAGIRVSQGRLWQCGESLGRRGACMESAWPGITVLVHVDQDHLPGRQDVAFEDALVRSRPEALGRSDEVLRGRVRRRAGSPEVTWPPDRTHLRGSTGVLWASPGSGPVLISTDSSADRGCSLLVAVTSATGATERMDSPGSEATGRWIGARSRTRPVAWGEFDE